MAGRSYTKTPMLDLTGITGESTQEIPTTGEISRKEIITEIEPTGDVYGLGDKAAELAFMEEEVEVFLHDGTGPNDEPVVQVGVNGVSVWLQRGQHHKIKRKYVLNLATAKPITYATVEAVKGDGSRTVNLRSHTGYKYPFSVLNDTPKGQAWLKAIQGAR